MGTLLYLDSARMGLMCERARLAHVDYIRLAGLEGCSLYFERLLRHGFDRWPERHRDQFPQLSDWQGFAELKDSLRVLVGALASTHVLLANRTAQLLRLGARLLAERCERVLLTDLTWPSYRRIVLQERAGHKVGISTSFVRDAVRDGECRANIVARIVRQYESMGCDGLLLTAVSHDGIQLPLDLICQSIARIRRPKFIIVDGAQAFCHVSGELGLEHCDLFVAGCHKWLQGHVPMGVGFVPSGRSQHAVHSAVNRLLLCNELDDPLLTFTRQMESDSLKMFSETVNLAALFSCRAAVAEQHARCESVAHQLDQRAQNVEVLLPATAGLGWRPLTTGTDFRTGIVMLQADDPAVRRLDPRNVRSFFLAHGISVSCYEDGVIRLAMLDRPWQRGELDLLRWALSCYRRRAAA